TGLDKNITGKAGQTSSYRLPTIWAHDKNQPQEPQQGRSTDRGLGWSRSTDTVAPESPDDMPPTAVCGTREGLLNLRLPLDKADAVS
ncbi:hypothetical protein, partial [Mycolicibacterium vanbaalenii]|uniref:hypothetical protein n=1 Tax=Mycolicibacterium vanbaalenii TaxID=110539 RepID=UPI0021F3143A